MTPVFSDLICSCSDRTVRWLWTTRHGSDWCNPGCPAVHLCGGHGTSHLSHSEGERRLEKNLWNQHVPKLCKLKNSKVYVLERGQVQEHEKRFFSDPDSFLSPTQDYHETCCNFNRYWNLSVQHFLQLSVRFPWKLWIFMAPRDKVLFLHIPLSLKKSDCNG